MILGTSPRADCSRRTVRLWVLHLSCALKVSVFHYEEVLFQCGLSTIELFICRFGLSCRKRLTTFHSFYCQVESWEFQSGHQGEARFVDVTFQLPWSCRSAIAKNRYFDLLIFFQLSLCLCIPSLFFSILQSSCIGNYQAGFLFTACQACVTELPGFRLRENERVAPGYPTLLDEYFSLSSNLLIYFTVDNFRRLSDW